MLKIVANYSETASNPKSVEQLLSQISALPEVFIKFKLPIQEFFRRFDSILTELKKSLDRERDAQLHGVVVYLQFFTPKLKANSAITAQTPEIITIVDHLFNKSFQNSFEEAVSVIYSSLVSVLRHMGIDIILSKNQGNTYSKMCWFLRKAFQLIEENKRKSSKQRVYQEAEGLYRTPGDVTVGKEIVETFRRMYNVKELEVLLANADVTALTSAIRNLILEMDPPIIPLAFRAQLRALAGRIEEETIGGKICKAFSGMNSGYPDNYFLMRMIFRHLSRIVGNSEKTKMGLKPLGETLYPVFFPVAAGNGEPQDGQCIKQERELMGKLIEFLIKKAAFVFQL